MQPDVDPQYRSILEVSFGFEELRTPLEHSHTHIHTTAGMGPLYLESPLPLSSSLRGMIVLTVVETLDCRFIVGIAF